MQVLIKKLLGSPLVRELLKAVMVAVFEAVTTSKRKSIRSRPNP